MNKISILHPIIFSFFSKNMYEKLGRTWRKKSFLYLLILIMVCSFSMVLMSKIVVSTIIDRYSADIINQLPAIEIVKGTIVTPEKKPYTINLENNEKIIIDASGKYKELKDTDAEILVTKNKVFYKRNPQDKIGTSFEIERISENYFVKFVIKNPIITREKLQNFINFVDKEFFYILYPARVISQYIVFLFLVLIYLGFAFLFGKFLKLNFGQYSILTLTILAITPSMVISTILWFFATPYPLGIAGRFITDMGFLIFAISCCMNENEQKNIA